VHSDFPNPARFSRRHLIKAVAIAVGALGASLPGTAHAQWDGDRHDGDGDDWGSGNPWGRNPWGGDPWHHHGGGGWGGGGGGGGGYNCFLRGTHIRAGDTYRPIETLAVGERVPTRFSGTATIRDISSFTVQRNEAGHWPSGCRPARINANALAENVPVRDLVVTETHAVLLDGFLIPIGSLVNGKTICLDEQAGLNTLEYFHIKFDVHDVIDAEGAPCESRKDPGMASCAPAGFNGGRSEIFSRMRSAMAPIIDRRQPADRIRDGIETRAGL
jgi:hypothetical protein